MTLSLSKKNVLSVMTMTLTMISLISPADAQTTCTSTSPDCCWVVRSWEKMGKKTTVDPFSATACCSIFIRSPTGPLSPYYPAGSTNQTGGVPWVYCTSDGTVIQLKWSFQGLINSIPSELENLRSLRDLRLAYNGLTGSVPSGLGNLAKLQVLHLHNVQNRGQLTGSILSEIGPSPNRENLRVLSNTGLTGTFTPRCGTEVEVSGTKVVICGCLAASTPPTIFPPPETHANCLASGSALTLAKRTQVSSQAYNQAFGGRRYTCHVDSPNKNPFADCTNSMAFLCNTSDTTWNSDGAKREICRTAVNQMYGQMNDLWQAVRRECGQWQWTDGVKTSFTGNSSSDTCATANDNLIKNAFYIQKDLSKVYVTSEFTISQNYGLWSKVTA